MDQLISGAHVHLLVNHAPIFGALFGLALLAASFVWAPDALRRAAFVVLIGTAIASWVADVSGDPAEDAIRGFPGVRRAVIHTHEEFAEKSLIAAGIVGVFALVALIKWRRGAVPRGVSAGMFAAAAIVSGMMVYTGLLGGRIRHSEVRPGATPADATTIEPPRVRPGAPPPNGSPTPPG
jgi:hypothetical protein